MTAKEPHKEQGHRVDSLRSRGIGHCQESHVSSKSVAYKMAEQFPGPMHSAKCAWEMRLL